jgi:3-oxoacyl-[acyl-carrier-protein] synthase-3
MRKTKITAVHNYTPGRIVTNEELSLKYGTLTAQQIFEKTGIRERRWSDDKTALNMAVTCIDQLLEKTNTNRSEIDMLIIGTLTPDFFFPSTAVACIKQLGLNNAYGFDVVAACPSSLYGIDIANGKIKLGECKKIIVCGVDRMSKTINAFEHKTGVLFGDAAAAILLEATTGDEQGVNSCSSRVVADNLEDVYFRTPFSSNDWSEEKFNLQGGNVYKNGVSLTVRIINEFLSKNSLSISDFDYIVPHQANINMIHQVAKHLSVPMGKFLMNIEYFGNTGGASVLLSLSQHIAKGILKKGDRVLLVSFGAGLHTCCCRYVSIDITIT